MQTSEINRDQRQEEFISRKDRSTTMRDKLVGTARLFTAAVVVFIGAGLMVTPVMAEEKTKGNSEAEMEFSPADDCAAQGGDAEVVRIETGGGLITTCSFDDGSKWACSESGYCDFKEAGASGGGENAVSLPVVTSGFSISDAGTATMMVSQDSSLGGAEAVAREVDLPTPTPQPPTFDSGFSSPGSQVAAPVEDPAPESDESAEEPPVVEPVDEEPTVEPPEEPSSEPKDQDEAGETVDDDSTQDAVADGAPAGEPVTGTTGSVPSQAESVDTTAQAQPVAASEGTQAPASELLQASQAAGGTGPGLGFLLLAGAALATAAAAGALLLRRRTA